MKGLFLIFHEFAPYSGITKKIYAQRDALEACGVEMHLCYIDIGEGHVQRRMVDGEAVEELGGGVVGKLRRRMNWSAVTRYITEHDIKFLYVRYDHNANPVLIWWFRRLKALGVKIALEIPTYPYRNEFRDVPFILRAKLFIEGLFHSTLARYVDRVVTFSDDRRIFECPTVRISNGVDFDRIKLKSQINDTRSEVHLLGVANIHFWHGFDRVIEGIGQYNNARHSRKVLFHIVGDGTAQTFVEYEELIARYDLRQYVFIEGTKSGDALDEMFEMCDMGIASLGRHRSGVTHIKTLKNREYAARGVPFVYSETDDDFEQMPYILKAPADDSPIDIEALLSFYDQVHMSPAEIRATVSSVLSWRVQMQRVLDQI